MIRTLTTLTLTAGVLIGLTGCNYSEDRHAYESTYILPAAPYVLDVATQETVWSYDVPPQRIIVVELHADNNIDIATMPGNYPSYLTWQVYPIDAPKSWFRSKHYWGAAIEEGRFDLQGRPVNIGVNYGDPIDPASVPADRSIEEIERDLPEPGEAPLPEPTAPEAPEAPAE